jgi:hypothetical protein
MKKLIFFSVLLANPVFAEEWMETINEAGGKIFFYSFRCADTGTGRQVVSSRPSGTTIKGCWYYYSGMVQVIWESGNHSIFDPASLTYKKSP